MKKIVFLLFGIVFFSSYSFSALWSLSYYNLIQQQLNAEIKTKMDREINYINIVQDYYKNDILRLEKIKEKNDQTLIKLHTKELLILEKLKNDENNILQKEYLKVDE